MRGPADHLPPLAAIRHRWAAEGIRAILASNEVIGCLLLDVPALMGHVDARDAVLGLQDAQLRDLRAEVAALRALIVAESGGPPDFLPRSTYPPTSEPAMSQHAHDPHATHAPHPISDAVRDRLDAAGPADGERALHVPRVDPAKLKATLAALDAKVQEYRPLFDSLAPAQVKAIGDVIAAVIHATQPAATPPAA